MQSFCYLILYKWWRLSPEARLRLLIDPKNRPTGTAWGLFTVMFVGIFMQRLDPFVSAGLVLEEQLAEWNGLQLLAGAGLWILFAEILFNIWGACFVGVWIGHIQKNENLSETRYWWYVSLANLLVSILLFNMYAQPWLLLGLLGQAIFFVLCRVLPKSLCLIEAQSLFKLLAWKWRQMTPKMQYDLLFTEEKSPTARAWGFFLVGFVWLYIGYLTWTLPSFWSEMPFREALGIYRPLDWTDLVKISLPLFVLSELVFNFWGFLFLGIGMGHGSQQEQPEKGDNPKPPVTAAQYWKVMTQTNFFISLFLLVAVLKVRWTLHTLLCCLLCLFLQIIFFILCKIFEPILYRKMQLFKSETLLFDANKSDILDEHFVKKDEK